MNYTECIAYLYSKLPMFQRIGAAALKKDLSNTLSLLAEIGNPHEKFKTIHIAGTNGKGTSAHSIAAILQAAGYKTGLYTSPHLKDFTERIKINGESIPQDQVIQFVKKVTSKIEEIGPSFFEVTVAMAFDYFHQMNVDIAVIEVGLGGRLDSTNVIIPEVSLITHISWDHMDILGDTLEKIAFEKAGIIKKNIPVVIGTFQPELNHVFADKANELNAVLHISDSQVEKTERSYVIQIGQSESVDFVPEIRADYYLKNIPGVLKVIEVLTNRGWHIPKECIKGGLENTITLTKLKGRYQKLRSFPSLIVDISHNEDGLRNLIDQVQGECLGHMHFVIGSVKDKDMDKILPLYPKQASYYFTQSSVPRSMAAFELYTRALSYDLTGQMYPEVNSAIEAAMKQAKLEDTIIVTGSTFVVAEIKEL